MAEAYYEPTPATDGATMNPVPGAVFQVFEMADTAFATPLSLRVGSGNPTATVTASATLATLPGVYVTSPNFEHVWKSGSFQWRRDSIDGAKKAVETAKNAASNSANAAAASEQSAKNAASLVNAPADTVMRDVAANPASAFAGQLNATIAERGSKLFTPLGSGSGTRFARQNPTVAHSFQTGHGWTVVSGAVSSNLNDTTDYYAGTQSISITTDTAGNSAIIGGTAPAIPTGKFYRLWVKANAPETLSRVRIFASSDTGFANYYSFSAYFSGSAPAENQRKWKAGEWVPIDFPWSDATTTGAPNRAALTYLRVLVNGRGGTAAATVRIGRLDFIDTPTVYPTGVVSLTYDDSFASHYTVARQHLSVHGFAGTLFPITERVGQAGYLTLPQITDLHKGYGWEIGAHATTYAKHVQSLDGMTHDERVAELGALRAWQQDNGFSSPTYAYPNGTFTKDVEADLALYYSLGRTAAGRTSLIVPDELPVSPLPYRLLAANGGTTAIATLKAEVDRCKANGTWLIIVMHDILTVDGGGNDMTIAEHKELVDYIATQAVPVRTMQQVLRASAA